MGNILANTRSSRSSDNALHHPSKNGLLYNNFPGLPCFKKITADKHVLAELLLVPFVIINLTRLTVGVCMKVRFKSKVTRGFSFSPLRGSLKAKEKPLGPG